MKNVKIKGDKSNIYLFKPVNKNEVSWTRSIINWIVDIALIIVIGFVVYQKLYCTVVIG